MQKNAAENLAPSTGNTNSTDSVNRELATWFAERGCAWSGTASELLSALSAGRIVSCETLPSTVNALYAHLRAQSRVLRSYGIEVILPQSCLRMVSLKTCAKERSKETVPVVKQDLVSKDPAAAHGNSNVAASNPPASSESSNKEGAPKTPPIADAMGVLLAITDMQEHIKKRLTRSDNRASSTRNSYPERSDLSPSSIGPIATESGEDALFVIGAVEERIRNRLHGSANDSVTDKAVGPETTVAKDVAASQVTNEERTRFAKAIMRNPVGASRNDLPDRLENTLANTRDSSESYEPVFESTGEALFTIVEVQEQLKKLSLKTSAIIDLTATKTQQMSRASGVAIALAREGKLLYHAETGVASKITELQCDSIFIRSCLETGETLQLQGPESNAAFREFCLRKGIKSLIISPFPIGGGLVGVIEFIFQERRSLQEADRITIEVVADAVSAAMLQA
jgi:hypothetical protein